ncbi:MAG: transaminase [archaeon]|nr:transaminase [archaeon]
MSHAGRAIRRIDRRHLQALIGTEAAAYAARNPKSQELFGGAKHLFGAVPMTWMNKWVGGFPLYLDSAHGNEVISVDGHRYTDFALGDTGAMTGHSPAPTVAAAIQRLQTLGGVSTMMPTGEAEEVAAHLARRFGLPLWSFTLSATDANRWAIRLARMVTGRSKVLAFSYGYHGTVDETFAVMGPSGETLPRPGGVGAPGRIVDTTRAAEFNDLESVERALAHGDVAVVVTEPALTNIGIVLPKPGFLEGLRALTRRHGALLLIDETHTFSASYGGATRLWGLQPDIFTIGKCLGSGIPSGAYGISEELEQRIQRARADCDLVDVGGIGGTLAGNALSVAAMKATLEEVLTPEAFDGMLALATRFTDGVSAAIRKYEVPWTIAQLGARAEYRFTNPAPQSGTEAARSQDDQLDEFMHLFMLNREIMMTPFHNMALMCPHSTVQQVDRHTEVFHDALKVLTQH